MESLLNFVCINVSAKVGPNDFLSGCNVNKTKITVISPFLLSHLAA